MKYKAESPAQSKQLFKQPNLVLQIKNFMRSMPKPPSKRQLPTAGEQSPTPSKKNARARG